MAIENNSCSKDLTRFVDIIQEKGEGEAADNTFLKFMSNEAKEQITFKEFHFLVNKASNKFSSELKDTAQVNDAGYIAVGYLSQSNHYCLLNHFGLMSLNVTPIILSPRNSVDILAHLLNQSQSKALVYGKEMESIALQCQIEVPNLKLIPKFEPDQKTVDFIEKPQPLLHIPKNELKNHVVIVLHSSGSTAFPKLIKITNLYIDTFLKRNRLSIGAELFYGNQLLLSPVFHIFGLSISWAFLNNSASIAFASSPTLYPKQIINDIEQHRPSLVAILPYLVKQLAEYCENNKPSWNTLKKINALFFGGAILPSDIGDIMSQNGVGLMNGYGSTETGFNAISDIKKNFLNLNIFPGIQYEIINRENDSCQLKILASDLGIAVDIADNEGYVIGDRIQIINHDPKSNQLEFRILGRMDDTIIHISGEKTNPIPMEETILTCPLVKSAVIVGSGKLSTSLLIQLNESEALNYSIMKIPGIIYSYIEKANTLCPSHSRIDLDLVYILPLYPDKTLPATVKGNVNRKKANLEFASEIENLYSKFTRTSLIV